MNLRQLEVFYAVVKAGSVTAAARNLHVSQPAISAVLKHAEQQLRIKLFERIGGRLHPTPEALSLLPDVEEIFGRIETLNRTVQEMRDGDAGSLVVATSPTLVNTLLPQAIAALRRISPALNIFLHSLPTPLAVDRVARREADLGLVYGPVKDSAVIVDTLARSEIVCAMPLNHPLAKQASVHACDLAGSPVISLGSTTQLGTLIDEACRAQAILPLIINIEASSSFTACLLVSEGAGLALIDRYTMLSGRFEDLIFKPFRPRIEVELCLIFPLNRSRRQSAVKLGDLLQNMLMECPAAQKKNCTELE
jgi:DNA-binding transcriptional LysR family regulator